MSKNTILLLATATLVVFTLAGWLVMEKVLGLDLIKALYGSLDPMYQVLYGIVYGGFTGILAWQLVQTPYLARTNNFFTDLIGPMQLSTYEVLFISCCAGIGEEVFFRGALQPVIGIWITSFLFVALHGYLNPWNRPIMIYGLAMVVVIVGISYLAEALGLVSAICAHITLDVVLLTKLSRRWKKQTASGPMEQEDRPY